MLKFASYLALFFVLATLGANAVNNSYNAYQIVYGPNYIQALISYTGKDTYYGKPTSPIVKNLSLTVKYDAEDELYISIDAVGSKRWRLPDQYPFSYNKRVMQDNPWYNVTVTQNPFSFAVIRLSTGETVFNTSNFDFIYSDLYISFGSQLPSQYLYGWGERASDFLFDSGTYTIWNKDQYCQLDDGEGGQQTYGTHPMYLNREKSGLWHVVFLRNINAMDLVYNATTKQIQYILTGGIIELKFFFGTASPDHALKNYHNYINGWTLMPFWAHGYHQSKWGMIYLQDMVDIVNNFTELGIPLDVIWSDIDYMYNFDDFTIDEQRYNTTQFKELAQQIRWVPIVDNGVSINYTSSAYQKGNNMSVWINSVNNNSNPLIGVVWPGIVHWPDFFHPNASLYWTELLQEFYDTVPYAGIWLDMNEISNFCYGEWPNDCTYLWNYLPDAPTDGSTDQEPQPEDFEDHLKYLRSLEEKALDNPYQIFPNINTSTDLPYLPGGLPLENKTISMDVLHYGGYQEYDVHNLNGFVESLITYNSLKTITKKRPYILSRSTYAGSGQFTSHWTGDNAATWEFLQLSIPEIFNFNLFGIPMTGSDICGFAPPNTTVELCARWMQLGSLYPFMRNHMALNTTDHLPYSLGDTVLNASMASLKLRYSLLKFYYSIFVRNGGVGTVFRPLFFDFLDPSLLSLQTQFLIGNELMGAPVLYEGNTQVGVYFPAPAKWYDFFTGVVMQDVTSTAQNITVDAPLNGTCPLFIKGGSVVHTQNVSNVTTTDQLNNVFNLVVALLQVSADAHQAKGQMMSISSYDDVSIDLCDIDCMININVQAITRSNGSVDVSIMFTPNSKAVALQKIYLQSVTLYGIRRKVCINCNNPDYVINYTFKDLTLVQYKIYTFTV